jgi:hypothetical protein
MKLEESSGYKKLLSAIEYDEKQSPNMHNYREKIQWIIDRAKHYAEVTGIEAAIILNTWEDRRNYWYMNYYQENNQPLLTGATVRVFDTQDDLMDSVGKSGFRCPMCNGVSKSPYKCDSGSEMSKGKRCDWNANGLFGTLGKGVFVFVKDTMASGTIFMPLAWE